MQLLYILCICVQIEVVPLIFNYLHRISVAMHRYLPISIVSMRFFWELVLLVFVYEFSILVLYWLKVNNGQWSPTSKVFYSRSYPLHYFLILILEKEPLFPFLMLSAKQGNYWYHFYNVFGMTRSLTGDWTRDLSHSMPVLYH